jgi:hypothetical protein
MDYPVMFKRKAVELARKLQTRFPSKLMFVVPVVEGTDDNELFEGYRDNVHHHYSDRIRSRDETFFMTTSDLDDPMQMVQMLRDLWGHMEDADKDAVWRYMELFEKLVLRASAGS